MPGFKSCQLPCLICLLLAAIGNAETGQQNTKEPSSAVDKHSAVLEVQIPPQARLSIDGRQVGTQRRFEFRDLQPERLYRHQVKAWFADGEEVQRSVLLKAGWRVVLPVVSARTVRPEMLFQTGHTNVVNSVAFSPDGKYVVTGSSDSTAVLWEAHSGRRLRTLVLAGIVNQAVFSPNGKQVLTLAAGSAVLWEAASGTKVRTFSTKELFRVGAVRSIVFSPDGRQVLAGCSHLDGNVAILWDAASGKRLHVYAEAENGPDARTAIQKFRDRQTYLVAFVANGKHVVTVSRLGTVTLRDAASGQTLRSFVAEPKVAFVDFRNDGGQMLLGSASGGVALWDTNSGKRIHTFREPKAGSGFLWPVAFSPDGKQVLTTAGSLAYLWDAATGQQLGGFAGHEKSITCLKFSPDGKQVLTGSVDQTAVLRETASGQALRIFSGDLDDRITMSVSGDGRRIVTGSSGQIVSTRRGPDGRLESLVLRDRGAVLWDTEAGRKLRTFKPRPVYSTAFSRDGKKLLIGVYTSGVGGRVFLYDAATGQELDSFAVVLRNIVKSVTLSSDGKLALTTSPNFGRRKDGEVSLWNLTDRRRIRAFAGEAAGALSPDGKYILIQSATRGAALWDATTGEKIRELQDKGGVSAAAFSPDGKQVATGFVSRTAGLWDVASGQRLRFFRPIGDVPKSMAFSPDGQLVLIGSNSQLRYPLTTGTVGLWDARTAQKLRSYDSHLAGINSVAFSPDGTKVVSSSLDCTTRIWDIASGDELARLITMDGGHDWVVLTPEGLYDGSRGGREKATFRIGAGLEVLPLDHFFQDFYYPGLLAEIWRGERPMPGKPLQLNPAPALKILVSPEAGHNDRVSVAVALTDQGGGVKGPWLQHNRATLAPGRLLKKDGNTHTYRFSVALVPGDNRLEVRAATLDGGRESEPAITRLKFDGKLPEPELYVLAVGINRFVKNSGISNLEYCVPDARAVADLFQKRACKLFKKVHVTPLYDDQATKEGILKAVTALADKARAQDTLVLYVASHGMAIGQRFYLIPHDFTLGKVEPASERHKEATTMALRGYRSTSDEREAAVRAHGLAIDELGEALSSVPALKRVLIFDTCHAGSAIALAGKRQDPFAFRGAMERFSRAQGVYSLSATAADELAAENKELGHSILTYALLAGLKAVEAGPLKGQPVKAGADGVDVLEWFRFARQHVPALYQRYVGRPQQVELSGEDQPGFPLLAFPTRASP